MPATSGWLVTRACLRVNRSLTARLLLATAALAAASAAAGVGLSTHVRGLQSGVTLTEVSPLSSSSELLRRLVSPLAQAQIQENLTRSGRRLTAQSLDLSRERFSVYVPLTAAPPGGYGLLVFVPPWEDARLPEGWGPVLDRYGVIFVSAEHSGNVENVLGRRVPLALVAEASIVKHFAVNSQHIYIGGFSGGARVALRIALGYPDVFDGALLNAGSDPIGGPGDLPPPRGLLQRFQDSMHVVYVSGENDDAQDMDRISAHSLRTWCVPDVDLLVTPRTAHEVADGIALGRALSELLEHRTAPEPQRQAKCRAAIDTELRARLQEVQSRISRGEGAAARKLLLRIDTRFGGLAAPRTVQLAQRCHCGVLSP